MFVFDDKSISRKAFVARKYFPTDQGNSYMLGDCYEASAKIRGVNRNKNNSLYIDGSSLVVKDKLEGELCHSCRKMIPLHEFQEHRKKCNTFNVDYISSPFDGYRDGYVYKQTRDNGPGYYKDSRYR